MGATDISECGAWGAQSVGMEICVWDDRLKGFNGDMVDMVSTWGLGVSLGIRGTGFRMGMDPVGMVMVSSHHLDCPRNFRTKILYFWECIPPGKGDVIDRSCSHRHTTTLPLMSKMKKLNQWIGKEQIVRSVWRQLSCLHYRLLEEWVVTRLL